ncbi:MAG: hypothetical protein ACI82F_000139 [Planctomycetota bacterium]|jgi:hypothetical protein
MGNPTPCFRLEEAAAEGIPCRVDRNSLPGETTRERDSVVLEEDHFRFHSAGQFHQAPDPQLIGFKR